MRGRKSSFKEKLYEIFPDLEVIEENGRYATVKNKYGLLKVRKDSLLRGSYPKINSAIDKTEYFKNQLLDKFPRSLDDLEILSEFEGYKTALICRDKFGLVKISPNLLMDGKLPSQKSAINYKEYLREKLKYIHRQFNYDFEVIDSDSSYLICPEHGKIKVKNESLQMGYQCPICKSELGSNIFYLVHLMSEKEDFYKVGISRKHGLHKLLRYGNYKAKGYLVIPIYEIEFNNSGDSKVLEQRIKEIIKTDLYSPIDWGTSTSRESFKSEELLQKVKEEISTYLQSCDRLLVK